MGEMGGMVTPLVRQVGVTEPAPLLLDLMSPYRTFDFPYGPGSLGLGTSFV